MIPETSLLHHERSAAPLGKIAEIATGYAFRSRLHARPDGNLLVVQMKDLTDDNRVDPSSLSRIEHATVKPHQLVRPGDLLFRSRGQTHTTALVTQDLGTAIVSAPLMRIRPRKAVLPAYLAWFINLPTTQARLARRAEGTSSRMIRKQTLAELEVTVPPLECQQAIVELADLAAEEQRIMARLADKRKQHMDSVLLKFASGGPHNSEETN